MQITRIIMLASMLFCRIETYAQQQPAEKPQAKPVAQEQQGEAKAPRLPEDKPLGAAGPTKNRQKPRPEDADFMIIRDRWRVGIPEDPRFKEGDIKTRIARMCSREIILSSATAPSSTLRLPPRAISM
ncbi:MAG: hypothetical protein IPO77_02685 [Acidobacteria bacterium]|nr:hypothetical protein [Acidobacteriota bacterium]